MDFKKIKLFITLFILFIPITSYAIDQLIKAQSGNLILDAANSSAIKVNKQIQASTTGITTQSGDLVLDAVTGSSVVVNKQIKASASGITSQAGNLNLSAVSSIVVSSNLNANSGITTQAGDLTLGAATGSSVTVLNNTFKVNQITDGTGTASPPGMVPIGGMIAVMPNVHANAWQPPIDCTTIKNGFMLAGTASGACTVPVCADCIIPTGTTLPNMYHAYPRGGGASSGTTGGANVYTPAGTVSQPTFTGNGTTLTVSNIPQLTGQTVASSTHYHTLPIGVNYGGSIFGISEAPVGFSGYAGTVLSSITTPRCMQWNPTTVTGSMSRMTDSGPSDTTTIVVGTVSPTSFTPTGTVSQPIFVGSQRPSEPAYVEVVWVIRVK